MAVVIVCVGCEGYQVNTRSVPVGQYLEAYDPDYRDGVGRADWTTERGKAKQFPTMVEAMQEWKRPSTVRPLRADGRPNRPLSAYSITFETI